MPEINGFELLELLRSSNVGNSKTIPVVVTTYSGMDAAITGQGLVDGMQIITKGNERVFPDMDVKVLNNSENK